MKRPNCCASRGVRRPGGPRPPAPSARCGCTWPMRPGRHLHARLRAAWPRPSKSALRSTKKPGLRGQGPRAAAALPPKPDIPPDQRIPAMRRAATRRPRPATVGRAARRDRRLCGGSRSTSHALRCSSFQKGPGKAGRLRAANEPDQPVRRRTRRRSRLPVRRRTTAATVPQPLGVRPSRPAATQIFLRSSGHGRELLGTRQTLAQCLGRQVDPRKYGTESPAPFVSDAQRRPRGLLLQPRPRAPSSRRTAACTSGAPVGRNSVAWRPAGRARGEPDHLPQRQLVAGRRQQLRRPPSGPAVRQWPLSRYAQAAQFPAARPPGTGSCRQWADQLRLG